LTILRRSLRLQTEPWFGDAGFTAAASAAPPSPTPGQASCPGLDTASFAQDWKSFSFEPPGVAPLVKFYGGTSPTDFTQSGRYADCATP
jgi:hypothetical protein